MIMRYNATDRQTDRQTDRIIAPFLHFYHINKASQSFGKVSEALERFVLR